MKVSLIVFIFWLFSVFQRWTHYSFSSWKWVWKLFRGLKLWIHDSPTKCKTTIFVFHPPPTQHERLWVTLALILTNYQQSSVSGVDVRPVWLQGREDWIHALSKPLVGRWWWWWGGQWSWSTPVLLCGHLFVSLPPPYFFSYLGLFWLPALHFTTLNIPHPLKVSSKSTLPSWGRGGAAVTGPILGIGEPLCIWNPDPV